MDSQPVPRVWRAIAIAGGTLAVLAAILLGLSGVFDFDIFHGNLDEVFWAIPLGVFVGIVGCVGWAWNTGRRGRYSLAFGLFTASVTALGIGYLVDSLNVHGSFGLVMLIAVPAVVLGIVLLLVAPMSKRG